MVRSGECGAFRPRPRGASVDRDTPHYVKAASAHGAFAIAVATGKYSVADLAAAGADGVLPDLLELDLLLTQLDV